MNDLAKREFRVFLVPPLNLLVSIYRIRSRCSIKCANVNFSIVPSPNFWAIHNLFAVISSRGLASAFVVVYFSYLIFHLLFQFI